MSVPGNKQTTKPSPFAFIELPEINAPLESATDPGLNTKTTEIPVLAARDSAASEALAAKPEVKIEFPVKLINSTTGNIINDTKTQNFLIKNHEGKNRLGLNAALSAHTLGKSLQDSNAAKELLRDNSTDANHNLMSAGNITQDAKRNLERLADGAADAELTGLARSKAVAHKAGYTHLAIQEFFKTDATQQTAERLITTLNNIRDLKLAVDD